MRYLLCLIFVGIMTHSLANGPRSEVCAQHIQSPNYNVVARGARLQGDVSLDVFISADGSVSKIEVVNSSEAPKLLIDEAIKNMTGWSFNKGEERKFRIVYRYRLTMPEIYCFVPSRVTIDFPNYILIETNFAPIMQD
jgi:TonB family protein